MAIVVESVTTSTGTNASLTASMPATRPDGDLYLLFVAAQGSGTISVSGWTPEGDPISVGTNTGGYKAALFSRAGSSEPSSYSVSMTGGVDSRAANAIVWRLSGADGIDAIEDNSGNGSTVTFPSVTPSVDDGLVGRFAGVNTDANFSTPGGHDEQSDTISGAHSSAASFTRQALSEASVATGTATSTTGSEDWAAYTLVIAPAPPSGDATITGEAATATATGLAGAVTITVDASISGEPATATAAGLAGAVTAVRSVSVSGEPASANAAGVAGAVTAVRNTSIGGEPATADAEGLAGAPAALVSASVSGEAATADAAGLAGAVVAVRNVSIAGEEATATAAGLAGTVIASIPGVAATAEAAGLAGVVTAVRIVTIGGVAATATAQGHAGLFNEIPVTRATLTSRTTADETIMATSTAAVTLRSRSTGSATLESR